MLDAVLVRGERVIVATRRHVLSLLFPAMLILAGFGLVINETCPRAVETHLNGRCPVILGFGMAAAITPFALEWLSTRYVLTNRRLFIVQSHIWHRVYGHRLHAIDAVSVRVGVLGRLFGFGDVTADSSATEGGRLNFSWVPAPEAFQMQIEDAVEWSHG